ncbi:MAG: DUF3533 domain-containing protein [Nocardioides sp.]|uniref:DUF3533 domain-containing protein n=1 Tax=Nocardioides sp. TaxID=35761 RepID=UPI0039E3D57E
MTEQAPQDRVEESKTFWAELQDAVSPRTVALVVGVLFVQVAFVASYVGAFHHQSPKDISFGVVAPTSSAAQLASSLNAEDGHPVSAEVVADRATAAARIERADLSAALVVRSSGKDELLVASGGGASLVTAVETIAKQYESAQGRRMKVTDVVPLQSGDARGLSGFYLVIGWLVGGYLVSSLLGVAKGSRPANPKRAAIRLGATVPYAICSGLGGALVVDQWFGALTGHFWPLAGLGALLVLSAATVTMAFQVLFGVIGIGLTVLLFVVLGNPSAGGAYQSQLLPEFWRAVGGWIPNGAGTDAVRRIVYFGGHGIAGELWLVAGYVVVGAAITMLASLRHAHRREAHRHLAAG